MATHSTNCSFPIMVHDSADVGTVAAKRGSRDVTSEMLGVVGKGRGQTLRRAYERLNEDSDEG